MGKSSGSNAGNAVKGSSATLSYSPNKGMSLAGKGYVNNRVGNYVSDFMALYSSSKTEKSYLLPPLDRVREFLYGKDCLEKLMEPHYLGMSILEQRIEKMQGRKKCPLCGTDKPVPLTYSMN